MDIVLIRDGIPVLSHDPWVHTTLCTTASGEPLRERVLIRDKTLASRAKLYKYTASPGSRRWRDRLRREGLTRLSRRVKNREEFCGPRMPISKISEIGL